MVARASVPVGEKVWTIVAVTPNLFLCRLPYISVNRTQTALVPSISTPLAPSAGSLSGGVLLTHIRAGSAGYFFLSTDGVFLASDEVPDAIANPWTV